MRFELYFGLIYTYWLSHTHIQYIGYHYLCITLSLLHNRTNETEIVKHKIPNDYFVNYIL